MIRTLWHRAFLVERPSISLSLFRLAMAFTVGAHVIPSLLRLDENYLSSAFKTKNFSFFPIAILRVVEASPDWVVGLFVVAFYVTLTLFTLGLWSQISCILMTLVCYYFYALNDYHIGTLSFDILLVSLFLMSVTNYHGDFLSLDSLRRTDTQAHRRLRPIFIQRMLQLQLAWTFVYTALSKITGGGNWLTGNPYYTLIHYPAIGVVRDFPLRAWLGEHPGLCYGLGITLLAFEMTIPILWFVQRTRLFGIGLGILFQIMLWLTLHVPTIFLFLFPPMMLLFIEPERLVAWIEAKRRQMALRPHGRLLYDGRCGFCVESVRRLQVLDLFGWVETVDFNQQAELSKIHPSLTPERCRREMVLIEPNGQLSGGFAAFRRLCLHLPLLRVLLPVVYLPASGWIGRHIYRWIARRRYRLFHNPTCQTNQCALPETDAGSSRSSASASEDSESGSAKT